MDGVENSKVPPAISLFTQAPVLVAVLITIIVVLDGGLESYISSIILMSIIPLGAILFWSRRTGEGYGITSRNDRRLPYIVTCISFTLNAMILYFYSGISSYFIISIQYLIGTMAMFALNFFTKLSVHAAGVSIFSYLSFQISPWLGAISIFLIPIVWWCRLIEKKHSLSELVLGSVVGYISPIVVAICFF